MSFMLSLKQGMTGNILTCNSPKMENIRYGKPETFHYGTVKAA